jgi:hypothetical protein
VSNCRNCGLPIKFIQRPGKHGILKWFPANPDGSDHWDLCSERRFKQLTPKQKAAHQAKHPVWSTPCRHTHYWIGSEAPWSKSLGEFRDFTEAEKSEGLVCWPFDAVAERLPESAAQHLADL